MGATPSGFESRPQHEQSASFEKKVLLIIKNVLLITNPASRRGLRERNPALAAFQNAGVDCEAVLTDAPGHAGAIAANAVGKYDAVFTLGGDGTAMEVIGAVGASGPPVGVIPGGTGNLLARAFHIPLRIDAAVRALLSGGEMRIDLGRLQSGHHFAVGAGIGADATMVVESPVTLKRRFGVLAYVLTGTRAVLRFDSFHVRAEVDGRVIEQSASSVFIANLGSLLSGLVTLGEGIRHDDGLLNLCVFAPRNVQDALRITRKLLRRDFSPDPCLTYAAGRHIKIEADPQRPLQADGELIGNTPFTVSVEPLGGRLLVPQATLARQNS